MISQRRSSLAGALVIGCALAFASALGRAGSQSPEPLATASAPLAPVEARVAQGRLSGRSDGTVEVFKGIPYAQPPVGARRWKPPAAASAWSGARDASDFAPSCMQSGPPHNVPAGSRAATTSEDCLYLNVWAPVKRAGPLPVMVWIHGGGNVQGSGADQFTSGYGFARDGVVLVTIDYRLGLFGFFSHPALAREAGATAPFGNYGLLDQIAALRWVRANAAAFGGDPENITAFGESAGGEDVALLLTSPLAAGAFAKAIVESGGFWSGLPTRAAATTAAVTVATKFHLDGANATPAQLRALDANALAAMQLDDEGGGPFVDGRVEPVAPLAAVNSGKTPAVPLVIGTNDDEGSLIAGFAGLPPFVTEDLAPADVAALRQSYGPAATTDAGFASLLFRDRFLAAPARLLAARQSKRAPAYLYRFDYVLAALRLRRAGAYHGSEIPFAFDSWPTAVPLTPEDRAVVATMHGCWVAFAATGTPRCPGVGAWPVYDPAVDKMMRFGANAELVPEPPELERLVPIR